MEKIIDCRGMACPLPVVNAKKEAEGMNAGDMLTVLVDNEIAVQNLTRFGEHKGVTVAAEKKSDREYYRELLKTVFPEENATIRPP